MHAIDRPVTGATRNVLLVASALAAALWWHRRAAQNDATGTPRLQRWHARIDGRRVLARSVRHRPATGRTAIVCVHGWGVSGLYFTPLARRLGRVTDVHVPDLPGHGGSRAADRALDISDMADWLARWMDAAGIGKAVLIGQSMGCQVVVETALRHRHRVQELLLIGAVPDPSARSLPIQFGRLLGCVPFERPALFPILARDYLRSAPLLLSELRTLMQYPLAARLRELTLPVAVARGEHDRLVPQRWFEHMARQTGAWAAVTIAGAGHAVQHSAPGQLLEMLATTPSAEVQKSEQGSGLRARQCGAGLAERTLP